MLGLVKSITLKLMTWEDKLAKCHNWLKLTKEYEKYYSKEERRAFDQEFQRLYRDYLLTKYRPTK